MLMRAPNREGATCILNRREALVPFQGGGIEGQVVCGQSLFWGPEYLIPLLDELCDEFFGSPSTNVQLRNGDCEGQVLTAGQRH